MAIPPYRLFFDTSAYIAALLSPKGAARELVRLAEIGAIRMVVSQEVIIEIDRVLAEKFSEHLQESRRIWKNLQPEMALDSSVPQLKSFLSKLKKGDALILCAAKEANVAAFVTWNTRDFMKADVQKLVNFPVVVPGEALVLFRKWIDPFLR